MTVQKQDGQRQGLAAYIDHTLLKADASAEAIEKLCREAVKHDFFSVCVNGVWVSHCRELLADSSVRISAVCGFPLGASEASVKAFEAAKAADQGAVEIDMVMQIGKLLDGDYAEVEADIRRVVKAVEGAAAVKVILETGVLNDEQKRTACKLAEQAGADYVKTSTGFGQGAATVEDIKLMRAAVSDHVGVKASGGIRDYETALSMIKAGATRLGTSAGVIIVSATDITVVRETREQGDY